MMNGMMPMTVDYPTGRASVPPALLLDIPSTSPAGGGPGLRHKRPLSASQQHLLTVATPPPPPAPTDVSAVNPELRQAQKSGDLYNISLNLSALQLAARPPSSASNTMSMSMRRAKSLQNIAPGLSYRPMSTPPDDDQEPGTTVVQVLRDDELPQKMPSTPQTTRRPRKPVSRSPSVRTLHIPPSPTRRSRSASRMSATTDDGPVIVSLKSTTENVPPGRASKTPVASVVGDSTVVFDVELTQQQKQQQLQHWEVEQTMSQHVVNSASLGRRSLLIESVRPSSTSGRQTADPRDTPQPTYTMTMNQQMTMNYEPPVPSPPPPQQDFLEETVHQRTVHAAYSGPTRSDTMNAGNGYPAVSQPPPATTKKKKKQPRMVNSGTQMAIDKSTQMRKTTKHSSEEDDERRSKKPTNKSPPKTLEPRMVSRATQMAVNKSTQITKPQSDDDDHDEETSSDEPHRSRRTEAGYKSKKKKSHDAAARKRLTNIGVQVTNTLDMTNERRRTPTFDGQQPWKTPDGRRGSEGPIGGYPGDGQQPRNALDGRRGSQGPITGYQDDRRGPEDPVNRYTDDSRGPQGPARGYPGDNRQPRNALDGRRGSQGPISVYPGDSRGPQGPARGYPNDDRQPRDALDGRRGSQRPVNGYLDDGQPRLSDEEIRPQRRQKDVEAIPDWPDNDGEESDLEKRESRSLQEMPPGRRPDDPKRPDSRRSHDPDTDPNRPGQPPMPSRGPYEGNDNYVRPSSERPAPPQAGYPSDHPSDSDDDRRRYRDVNAAPSRPGDYGPGMDRPDRNSAPMDQERYTTIQVESSAAFPEQDEAYLQQWRLGNASTTRSLQQRTSFQPRSSIQTRTSLQPRTRSTLTAKQEEARGFTKSAFITTIIYIVVVVMVVKCGEFSLMFNKIS